MKSHETDILLLGFFITEGKRSSIDILDKNPSRQTYNYHSKLVKLLSKVSSLRLISTYPVSDYPICSQKVFGYERENVCIDSKVVENQYIPFINTPLLKLLTRFVFSTISLFKECLRRKPDYIAVYSVHMPFMLSSILMSKLFGIKTLAIWTDPPAVQHLSDNKIKRYLRGVEKKISRKLMSKFDKLIVITKSLAEDYCVGKPYLVIDSIHDSTSLDKFDSCEKNSMDNDLFTYTGTISRNYGLDLMIETFSSMPNTASLHLYGSGPDVKYLTSKIDGIINIEYKGLIDINDVKKVQSSSDFLINIRNNSDDFTKYSFPSKITEYLLSGTPVISSVLPGIPKEYYEFIVPVDGSSIVSLKESIDYCVSLSWEERASLGEKGVRFVESRSQEFWLNKVEELIIND